MPRPASRRSLIAGAGASLAASAALAGADPFAAIEARTGGRLGVAALDVASGARLGRRADERFLMCSTFKLLLVASVLARVDHGQERIDRFVPYREADLLPYAPTTRANIKAGGMHVRDLCAAAVTLSDNTAANLLLASVGGPAGWTRFARSLGDAQSRLDRTEPELNTGSPGDPRDTTTPAAMLEDLRAVILGSTLSRGSNDALRGWMAGCKTGLGRLRAGLPAGWPVGDKTGTGGHGVSGDLAVAFAPGGPIVIVSYLEANPHISDKDQDAAHAEVGRIVAQTFRRSPARRPARVARG